jgi:hypothetical protein
MSRLTFILLILASSASAREVQSHGLVFEKWLRDTFFGGHVPESYTQRWDIPAEANTQHGGIPVNPKAIKYGTPLDFGDALRQFEITEKKERFLLIVGFWEQTTPTLKTWVNAQTVEISPADWARLWHPVSRADLEKLDRVIKDKSLSIEAARTRAQEIKKAPPFTQSVMQVNPKIDDRQRRLQCSLRFADFFTHLASMSDPGKQKEPKVFGITIPPTVPSTPRSINEK